MFNTLSLKEVPVEVDLAIEAGGYTPVYTQYGNKELDMRRCTRLVEGHQVTGVIDEEAKTFTVYGVSIAARLNQTTLDAIESRTVFKVDTTELSDADAQKFVSDAIASYKE